MVFAVFARGWGPLHTDMTEAWAWANEPQLGYSKHPPFSAWMAALWFTVFPRTNWGFYFLSTINAAVGLAGVWMLAGLFLGTAGRLASVLFLVLTPHFTFWALKFNANSALLSTWPWATYFLVRSLHSRRAVDGIAAGLIGAAALLTKYYSVVLCASLLLAALLHPDRRSYWRSAAPYCTLLFGLAGIAPHVWWVVSTGFTTIDYALSKAEYAAATARISALLTLAGGLASLGVGAAAFAVAFGGQFRGLLRRAAVAAFEAPTAWLMWLAWAPLIFTLAAYLVGNFRVTGSFLIPAFFAVPVAFLVSSRADVAPVVVRRIAITAAVLWLPLLLASPLIGYMTFRSADRLSVEPRSALALAATEEWHKTFGTPLKFVSGAERLATAAAYYSPDAPSYRRIEFLVGAHAAADQVKQEGIVLLCGALEQACIDAAAAIAGESAHRLSREYASSYFGRTAPPQSFVIFMRGPREKNPT